jgi:hypothetical protein
VNTLRAEISEVMSNHVSDSYTWQKLSQCQMKLKEADLLASNILKIIEEAQTLAGYSMEHYKITLNNLQKDEKIR